MKAHVGIAMGRGARTGTIPAVVSSRHNPTVKWIRSLKERRERERTGLFYVDSLRLVAEATQQRADIRLLVLAPERIVSPLAQETAQKLRTCGAPVLEMTGEVFDSLALRECGQGVGAVVAQRWEPLEQVRADSAALWVALDGVQYPGNLGTILRSCDAAGGAGALLLGRATDPYDPAAVRASLGAVLSLRIVRTTFGEFVAWKQRTGCTVIGTSPHAATDYRAVAYRQPLVLLMGCERNGLSDAQQAACDAMVRIPMAGRCDSLNLATATSLVLYETLYQRQARMERRPDDV